MTWTVAQSWCDWPDRANCQLWSTTTPGTTSGTVRTTRWSWFHHITNIVRYHNYQLSFASRKLYFNPHERKLPQIKFHSHRSFQKLFVFLRSFWVIGKRSLNRSLKINFCISLYLQFTRSAARFYWNQVTNRQWNKQKCLSFITRRQAQAAEQSCVWPTRSEWNCS